MGGMRGKASANSASAQRKIKCLILHKLLNTTFAMTPGEFHPLKEENAKKKKKEEGVGDHVLAQTSIIIMIIKKLCPSFQLVDWLIYSCASRRGQRKKKKVDD